jgi:dTDP-4-amino-4,6-dideoxygalactose transaminase
MVDKYSWVDIGSSYLPSELQAAYLWGQLEMAEAINADRLASWLAYRDKLGPLAAAGAIEIPVVPETCLHNAHMFYLLVKDLKERTALLEYFKQDLIGAVFHYVPLHSAPAGLKYGRFSGRDICTTSQSERLIRLPLYYGITGEEIDTVCEKITEWSGKN